MDEKYDVNNSGKKEKAKSLASCGSNSKGKKKSATNNQWA